MRIAGLLEPKDAGRPFGWKVSSALAITFVFTKDSFLAEIADQVNGYSEGYDILEKEQAQKAHVPHAVSPGNGNNRTGGSEDHRASYKEHERYDESTYNTGFRSHIACDNQYRCSDLGKTNDIGADIRAE